MSRSTTDFTHERVATSFTPEYVVVDYETELDGAGSTDFWHPRFRVTSAAFSWFTADGSVRSEFVEGEHAVGYFLERAVRAGVPLIAHNVPFELGVTQCRYPEIAGSCVWHADTMRLVQVYDNGGDAFAAALPPSLDEQLDRLDEDFEDEDPKWIGGLSLANAVQRILALPDHKEEAHAWLRANVAECRKGRVGKYLGRLPRPLLERYNVGDTSATLRLYAFLVDYFAARNYDWRLDHQLYFSTARNVVAAKIRGVRVDREALAAYAGQVEREITEITEAFSARFAVEIRTVERQRLLDQVRKRKTLRGRRGFVRRYRLGCGSAVKEVRFNVGSNKQLSSLFVDTLRMECKFRTDKGAPSFKSAVLGQWGSGGDMLKTRRKRLLVLKQAQALLELSAVDGRWHCDLKVASTATGRLSGGSHGS